MNEIEYNHEMGYFLVPSAIAQNFINHLNSRNIIVHPPQDCLTVATGDLVELELQQKITEQSAFEAVETFYKTKK